MNRFLRLAKASIRGVKSVVVFMGKHVYRSGQICLRYNCRIDYPSNIFYADINDVSMGADVYIASYSEIVVRRNEWSSDGSPILELGNSCVIGAFVNMRVDGYKLRIGDNTMLGQGVTIVTSQHDIKSVTDGLSQNRVCPESSGDVTIGENCWIGAGAVILPGVEIGSGSVIGANAVVTRNVGKYEVWVGVPARFTRKIM